MLLNKLSNNKLYRILQLVYKKIGADFTMTSEHSEHLPLPHTKGTKPAPL